MAGVPERVQEEIGFFKREAALKEYTDKALADPDLSPEKKIKLVHINQDNRLSIIKRVQKHTFEHLFKKRPNDFFTNKYHYDWWIFPMYVPKKWNWPQRNYDASLNLSEAQTLLNDEEFADTYLKSIAMYLIALKKHGWNNYVVRYARMLQSIALFLQAARKIECWEFWDNLKVLAKEAVFYARDFVLFQNEDYSLLLEGFEATKCQIEKGLMLKTCQNLVSYSALSV